MRNAIFFLTLFLLTTFSCQERNSPQPTCSEEGPACQSVSDCADAVQIIEIPDLPLAKLRSWYNAKVGFAGNLPDSTYSVSGVLATYVIQSKKEAEALQLMADSPLTKIDYCQYTVLAFDVNKQCPGLVEQQFTKQCEQYRLTGLITQPGVCLSTVDPPSRHFLVVPKLAKCAKVQFELVIK